MRAYQTAYIFIRARINVAGCPTVKRGANWKSSADEGGFRGANSKAGLMSWKDTDTIALDNRLFVLLFLRPPLCFLRFLSSMKASVLVAFNSALFVCWELAEYYLLYAVNNI